jgi:hypothetical protein
MEELFDRLAADLAKCRPELQGFILCPLCLGSFPRTAIALEDKNGLTLEHIVPSALGGRLFTLTCRGCNNSQVSALDAHFVRMIRAYDWAQSDGPPLKGTIEAPQAKLPMKISWGAEKKVIRIQGGAADAIQNFRSYMQSMQAGSKFHLQINLNYVSGSADRALIRMAYLSLFYHFGYDYALSEAAAWVRELIGGSHAEQVWKLLPKLADVEERGRTQPVIICPVHNGEVILAFLIVFRVEGKLKLHRAALLPAMGVPRELIVTALSDLQLQLLNRHSIQVLGKAEER